MTEQDPHSPNESQDSLGSITGLFQSARNGDEVAAADLWKAYARRLQGLARAVLTRRGVSAAMASEESAVNSAFGAFFQAIAEGRYDQVADRDELWRLLSVITRNRVLNRVAKTKRRPGFNNDPQSWLDGQASLEPSPEDVAQVCETLDNLESYLRNRAASPEHGDSLIQVLHLQLAGHKQREIAEQIGRSEVTVRNQLRLIRQTLRKESRDEGWSR